MKTLIEKYLESKKLAWAPSTLRSERYRLLGLEGAITGDPSALWTALEKAKPYARVTAWTRVTSFWQWLIEAGHKEGKNEYEAFRNRNLRCFKNTYQPRFPQTTFQEAVDRVSQLQEGSDRDLALQILGSGTRFHEAIQEGSEVIGKGSKPRTVYRPGAEGGSYLRSYSSFVRALKAVGLKPHDLRKLCAARLVEAGLQEKDLLKVMGWTSMETAKFYLSPKRDAELKQVFNKIHKELNHG